MDRYNVYDSSGNLVGKIEEKNPAAVSLGVICGILMGVLLVICCIGILVILVAGPAFMWNSVLESTSEEGGWGIVLFILIICASAIGRTLLIAKGKANLQVSPWTSITFWTVLIPFLFYILLEIIGMEFVGFGYHLVLLLGILLLALVPSTVCFLLLKLMQQFSK